MSSLPKYAPSQLPLAIIGFFDCLLAFHRQAKFLKKALNERFNGSRGVRVYVDNVLIWGANQKEHNERLKVALLAAAKAGLTFNASRYWFAVEVFFLVTSSAAEAYALTLLWSKLC